MRIAVVGGGVVGCAVALELARRDAAVVLFEAEPELGLAASGTNSGILHTGFDSTPGELETELILRGAALRPRVIGELGIPVLKCGAELGGAPPELLDNARRNGVEAELREDGTLVVPGEWVTDPVAYTLGLGAAAEAAGAELRTGARVDDDLPGFDRVVNCAGLHADTVARLFGDRSFEVYPRKGEFLVFAVPLDRILLPVPAKGTKGVLVFPTLDGRCVAGPTAVDADDKDDWSVRERAREEIVAKAVAMHPPLDGARPVAAYAGLRPAGRGVNYVVGPSRADARLVNVAAIRSTGLSASLGIAEHVADLLVEGPARRPLAPGRPPVAAGPWWRRTAEHRAIV